jgi:hypothetical protein
MLATKNYDYLNLKLSNNEFRDPEAKLIAKHLENLLKANKIFEFDFLNTAISESGKRAIERIFKDRPDWLYINNIQLADSTGNDQK